jgi:hypothetical protein
MEWRVHAACRHFDPEWWFDPQREDEAVSVCSVCPVRHDCLLEAVERDERFGVWGGVPEQQRSSHLPAPRYPKGKKGFVLEEYWHLHTLGLIDEQIAERFGIHVQTLKGYLREFRGAA